MEIMNGFKSIHYSFSLWIHHIKNPNNEPSLLSVFYWMSLRYQVIDSSQDELMGLLMKYGLYRYNEASLYRYKQAIRFSQKFNSNS